MPCKRSCPADSAPRGPVVEQAVSRRGDSPGPPRPPQLLTFRQNKAAWDAGWVCPGSIRLTQLRCRPAQARCMLSIYMIIPQPGGVGGQSGCYAGSDSKAKTLCCLSSPALCEPISNGSVRASRRCADDPSPAGPLGLVLPADQGDLQATAACSCCRAVVFSIAASWLKPPLAASQCHSRVSQPNS